MLCAMTDRWALYIDVEGQTSAAHDVPASPSVENILKRGVLDIYTP